MKGPRGEKKASSYERSFQVMHTAKQTNAIVSSLFPENVRSRIMEQAVTAASGGKTETIEGGNNDDRGGSDPIADLFPYTTIMFLDIAGMYILILFACHPLRPPVQTALTVNFRIQASRRGPANESRLRYSSYSSRCTGEQLAILGLEGVCL